MSIDNIMQQSNEEIARVRAGLNTVYNTIPDTVGCMENINKPEDEGGCNAWCCLTPETLVFTSFGPVPIKDVKAGINVMTKNGWRRVVRTGSRFVSENVTRLRTCYGREITLTSNHEVYVDLVERKERYSESQTPTFVPAGQLVPKAGQNSNQPGHYVVFPKIQWERHGPTWVFLELADYIDDLFYVTVSADDMTTLKAAYTSKRMKGAPLPATIIADQAFVRIVGLFLAEGSFGDSQIEFHLNSDEEGLREEIYSFARKFGLKASHRVTNGKSLTVRVFSRVLKRLFLALCGDGCDKKRLDPHFLELITTSRGLIQALHDGCYAGDGARAGDNGGDYSFTTTSPDLAGQMVYINHLLNSMVGVYRHDPVMKRPSWTLNNNRDVKYKDYIETETDFRVPVRSVESVWYEGFVYDIEVEGEHSFFTEAGEVHNCRTQNPQILYAEFVNIWRYVNDNWDRQSVINLIAASVTNYLSNAFSKGCVLHDGLNGLCTIHEQRPFNCRIYGITPEEEFKPRYEALKVLHPEIHDQCHLVKTADGKPITKEQTDGWWHELAKVEMTLGIPARRITDKQNGTYRTFHDHVILTLYGDKPQVMKALTTLRLNGSEKAKASLVNEVVTLLKKQEADREEADRKKAAGETKKDDEPKEGDSNPAAG